MNNFFSLVSDLEQGHSIHFDEWEEQTRMYILDNELVCQRGDQTAYNYDLSWREMQAKKWSLVL